jgi:hypothetical protein
MPFHFQPFGLPFRRQYSASASLAAFRMAAASSSCAYRLQLSHSVHGAPYTRVFVSFRSNECNAPIGTTNRCVSEVLAEVFIADLSNIGSAYVTEVLISLELHICRRSDKLRVHTT